MPHRDNRERTAMTDSRSADDQKRDFSATPEPEGESARSSRNALHFVVRKYAAIDVAGVVGARKSAPPPMLAPQLATPVEGPPADGGWLYELKLDGYRMLARITRTGVHLFTRSGHDWSGKLPELAKAISRLPVQSAWIDGEIVVLDAGGVPTFSALQSAFDIGRTGAIRFLPFDLPYLNGYDLRRAPLRERRTLLRRIIKTPAIEGGPVRFSEDFPGTAQRLLELACRHGLEGLIGKRWDAPYVSGRTESWIKLTCRREQEFVIGGYTEPCGSRTGFSALLLGVYDPGGVLRYAGCVSAGFDEATLRSLHRRFSAWNADRSPFGDRPSDLSDRGVHWMRPHVVAEVSFAEWTRDGRVRHALFQGLRADKPAREVTREQPLPPPPSAAPVSAMPARPHPQVEYDGVSVAGLVITHQDRMVDPAARVTKVALARYYEMVAPQILPHLRDRPVAWLRGPEGLRGELFFQKHLHGPSIPGIKILDPRLDPGREPWMVIESVAGLVGAVQQGMIELHTWNATADAVERPDRVVFDLDPDPALPWERVVESAQLTRTLLEELGLKPFVKTSGGKGLHVVVPLIRHHSWEQVKSFGGLVARYLADSAPRRLSATMGARNRVHQVFVDHLRNRRGATTVSAYSARSRPGLGVSVPVAWEEISSTTGADQWTIATISSRLSRDDPWADYETSRRSLSDALTLLDRTARRGNALSA